MRESFSLNNVTITYKLLDISGNLYNLFNMRAKWIVTLADDGGDNARRMEGAHEPQGIDGGF